MRSSTARLAEVLTRTEETSVGQQAAVGTLGKRQLWQRLRESSVGGDTSCS